LKPQLLRSQAACSAPPCCAGNATLGSTIRRVLLIKTAECVRALCSPSRRTLSRYPSISESFLYPFPRYVKFDISPQSDDARAERRGRHNTGRSEWPFLSERNRRFLNRGRVGALRRRDAEKLHAKRDNLSTLVPAAVVLCFELSRAEPSFYINLSDSDDDITSLVISSYSSHPRDSSG
jgi:hypothetical protein